MQRDKLTSVIWLTTATGTAPSSVPNACCTRCTSKAGLYQNVNPGTDLRTSDNTSELGI